MDAGASLEERETVEVAKLPDT